MRIPRTGGRWPSPWADCCIAVLAVLTLGGWLVGATGCGDSSSAQSGGAGATAAANQEGETAEEAIAIEVGQVGRGSLASLYATSATLRADKQATVTARTRGIVRKLLVEEGDWVDEGQALAVLEDDEQRIAFDQATANWENKRREFERAESLHAQELMSQEAYETARRESVDAQHTAELAELTLSRTVIRATFAGRVLARHVDVGANVNDGTAVYDIADLDPLYADVQVPERQVAQLRPGQTVRLMADDETSSGAARIERIAPSVDPTSGTVKVTLAVRRAGTLRPGSFVRVGIVTDTHENVLVVPRSALVSEGRRWHLFRLKEEDDKRVVELIEITRGFEESDRVEIIADTAAEQPLREGDPVVVTGASSLSDGSAVQVLDPKAEDPDEVAGETHEEAADANGASSDEAQGVAA